MVLSLEFSREAAATLRHSLKKADWAIFVKLQKLLDRGRCWLQCFAFRFTGFQCVVARLSTTRSHREVLSQQGAYGFCLSDTLQLFLCGASLPLIRLLPSARSARPHSLRWRLPFHDRASRSFGDGEGVQRVANPNL